MQLPVIDSAGMFLLVTFMAFAIVFGRYILIAWIFHNFFNVWSGQKWMHRKISARSYNKQQFRKEVGWSLITAAIFSLTAAAMLWLWQHGYTKLYTDVHEYSLIWLPLSLVLALLLHETYYYWLHRWMHQPKIFRIVHKVHHESNITSPWTAFSFHPFEGFFQALFLPLLILLMPVNLYVLLVQLTLMTFSSVINHLDIEIYPKNFNKHALGRWLIGASHHSLHHKQFRFNYGLYFTFWDKWKKTESPAYDALFHSKTNQDVAAQEGKAASMTS